MEDKEISSKDTIGRIYAIVIGFIIFPLLWLAVFNLYGSLSKPKEGVYTITCEEGYVEIDNNLIEDVKHYDNYYKVFMKDGSELHLNKSKCIAIFEQNK